MTLTNWICCIFKHNHFVGIMTNFKQHNTDIDIKPFYHNTDTDIYFHQYVIDPLSSYFKHVDPNLITMIGLPFSFSFFLLHLHPNGYSLFIPVFIFSLIRVFCDFMDGHVARRYNKCSKLGGFLDTVSDMIHVTNAIVFMISYYFQLTMRSCVFWWIGIFILNMLNIAYGGALTDHDNMKNGKGLNGFVMYMGKYHAFLLNICYFVLIYLFCVKSNRYSIAR